MPQCCVFGCTNVSGENRGKKISHHRLPSEPNLRGVWITKINRKNWTPTPNAVVCSQHFKDDDFEPDMFAKIMGTSSRQRKLKTGALPSLLHRGEKRPIQDVNVPSPGISNTFKQRRISSHFSQRAAEEESIPIFLSTEIELSHDVTVEPHEPTKHDFSVFRPETRKVQPQPSMLDVAIRTSSSLCTKPEMDDISNRANDFTDGGRRSRRKCAVPKKVDMSLVEGSPAKPSDSSLVGIPRKKDRISNRKPNAQQSSNFEKEDNKPVGVEVGVEKHEITEQPFKLLCYRFDHKRRGVCLIISNSTFDPHTGMPFRLGAEVDLKNVRDAFDYLGFECVVCCEFTRRELKEKATELSQREYSDSDCFACVVLTHGESNGQLYGRDGLYHASDLLNFFKGDRCPTLTGKPKLFFIQACRGSKLDIGTALPVNQTDGCDKGEHSQRIPLEADFLVAYSVTEGFYSWRNSVAGSWYVQALTKILRLHGTKIDLLTLLTRVNYVVAYEFESNASVEAMSRKKQIPCVQSMLTKQMYFIPK